MTTTAPATALAPAVPAEAEVRAQLRAWIVGRAKKPVGPGFGDETLVLQEGILNSLDVVEFVLFIESLRGEDIDPDAIEPDAFANVSAIYSRFFGAAR